jgi:hypothetical protein
VNGRATGARRRAPVAASQGPLDGTLSDVRRSDERSETNLAWLRGRHSFWAGGQPYGSATTHHGLLLVDNEDTMQPGTGFETHLQRPALAGRRDRALATRCQTVAVLATAAPPGRALPQARLQGQLAEASYALYQTERHGPSTVDWQATLNTCHDAVRGA